jgi:shikimate dehydrogenase
MRAPAWLEPLQALVENRLPVSEHAQFIGLIGDHPSTYARSPRIWRPALDACGIDAAYVPLDVSTTRLAAVVAALRRGDCLGANVTAPYKSDVLPMLDEVDQTAQAVGAVNTIVRRPTGRLAGANTDGLGLIGALRGDAGSAPLVSSLHGATVLLIGAGGAARAAAAALAPVLGRGTLLVTNRHLDRAQAVQALARRLRPDARSTVVAGDALEERLPSVDLVINASLRGQAGICKMRDGWTCLEPYSAFAPAAPVVLPPMPEDEFIAQWSAGSAEDIAANLAASRARVRRLPGHAVVYDMIYAPLETVTLRHAREANLQGANGRAMNIGQAVAAFVDHICRATLATAGGDPAAIRSRVARVMSEAWEG